MPAVHLKKSRYKPYEVYNEQGKNRVILLCDHASNKIPKRFKSLGLSKKEINRHIGWDIGAALVAKKIAKELNSTLIMSGYSRLIIDCNRPFGVSEAFIKKSENTIIPGNLNINRKDKINRAKLYCLPYREKINSILKKRIGNKITPIIISMHSFTDFYKGVSRPWHLGLLYRKDRRLTSLILKQLKKDKSIKVGINEPYKCNLKGDFSIPYFAELNGLPNILFEIRQDLIRNKKGVDIWSKRISKILKKTISHPEISYPLIPPRDILAYYKKGNKI